MRAADVPAIRRALLRWHRRHGLPAPWRESGDPYRVLVAAVMAQQTQMSRVLPKYESFLRAFPTIGALAAASAADVLRAWEGLGYNLRALRLHRAARLVVERGGFPTEASELERIDGIGPCTAAVIASFAFGRPAAAVDTNVRRIIERFTGDGLRETEVHAQADVLISRRAPARWNQSMMDLGALVCTARAPRCDACPLARWCRSRRSFSRVLPRAAGGRASYHAQPPYRHSRRYYRGRIVQALRELAPTRSLTQAQLLREIRDDPSPRPFPAREGEHLLGGTSLREIIASLERDGLVRMERGRLRLP